MAVANSIVKPRSKRKQASQSEFEYVWPGVKRCMDCGYCLAHESESSSDSDEVKAEKKERNRKEASAHSTYHGKFYKAQREYGEKNVLLYKDFREAEKGVEEKLLSMKDNDITLDAEKASTFFDVTKSFLTEFRKWLKSVESLNIKELSEDIEVLKDASKKLKFARLEYKDYDYVDIMRGLSEMAKEYRVISECIDTMKSNRRNKSIKGFDEISFPRLFNEIENYVSDINSANLIMLSKHHKVLLAIEQFCKVEYTKSLRLWDMCKLHPPFEDYCILLWNTPKFREFIKKYLTENQYNFFVKHNLANRKLVDFHFKEAPYYFGGVEDTGLAVSDDVKDFTYMENLINADEEDSDDDAEDMDSGDKSLETGLLQLGKWLSKKK